MRLLKLSSASTSEKRLLTPISPLIAESVAADLVM